MLLRSLILSSVIASALAAQGFTSPAGLITTEGSSNHDYILFKYNDLRWQQLDDTSLGINPMQVTRISWRRDGVVALDPTWIARTIDIKVVLSDSVQAGAISEGFDANYLGAPTVAFASRPVSLPDWTAAPAVPPAPFDLNLTLDAPWVYTGVNSYLWELQVTNNASNSDYGNDFQSATGSTGTSNSGTIIGTGCIATGQTAAMTLACALKNQVSRFRAGYTVTRAPALAPAVLFIDGANANLPFPGLCANLIAMPTLQVGMGNADAAGAITFALENIPFQPSTVGVTIYSQAIAIDVGQAGLPVALSPGRSNVFPATPATPTTVSRVYEYRLAAGSMRAASVWTGGIVTLLD